MRDKIHKYSFSKVAVIFLLSITVLIFPQVVFANDDSNQSQGIIKDKMLEEAIRKELYKPDGELTKDDLNQLISLDASGLSIEDLTGLEYAKNIEKLAINENEITDLSPLKTLTQLRELYAFENKIKDISLLSNLSNLESVGLASNQISNISPIANLRKLTYLNLNENRIIDISTLSALSELEDLRISNNQIKDISPLTSLKNLTFIGLNSNQVSDIGPLTQLPKLEDIYVADNQIKDITAFKNFDQHLGWIFLDRNQITDISPLVDLAKKGQLSRWVDILFNELDIENKDSEAWADIQTLLNYDVFLTYDPQLPKTTSTTSAIYGVVDYSGWIDSTYYSSIPLDSTKVTILNDKDEKIKVLHTNENGAFTVEGLIPGNYTVISSNKGSSTKWEEITLKTGQAKYVEHELHVMNVEGDVKDANGTPIDNFEIDFVGLDNVFNTFSSKDNGYFKISEMNPDVYDITVIAEGYETYTTKTYLNGPEEMHFELTPIDDTASAEDTNRTRVKMCNKLFVYNDLPEDLNSRPLLPLKEMFKKFNIEYTYNGQEKTINAWREKESFKLEIGSNKVDKNGKLIDGLTNIVAVDGKSYIPLDLLSKISDKTIVWNKEIQTISMYDSEIVEIPDPHLKKTLSMKLDKSFYDEITLDEIESITALEVSYKTLDLTGLEYAKNLEYLSAEWINYIDLSALGKLEKLKVLRLDHTRGPNLEIIGTLNHLESLSLENVYFRDISFLKNLTNLKYLDISNNEAITDISSLAQLNSLETLFLNGNKINDMSVLVKLDSLKGLDMTDNPVTNLSFLSKLKNLVSLNVETEKFNDLSILPDLIELRIYVAKNDLQQVKRLLRQGVSPNAEYAFDETLLMDAIVLGDYDIAKTLISAGANIDVENFWGESVLQKAIHSAGEKIINLLIANRVVVNGDDLKAAVLQEDLNIMKKFLDYGADPNQLSYDYKTALMTAAEVGDYDMAKLLLDYGANPNYENKNGQTAYSIALSRSNYDIVDLLWSVKK